MKMGPAKTLLFINQPTTSTQVENEFESYTVTQKSQNQSERERECVLQEALIL